MDAGTLSTPTTRRGPNLTFETFRLVREDLGADTVHVIAHSMGSRLLANTIAGLAPGARPRVDGCNRLFLPRRHRRGHLPHPERRLHGKGGARHTLCFVRRSGVGMVRTVSKICSRRSIGTQSDAGAHIHTIDASSVKKELRPLIFRRCGLGPVRPVLPDPQWDEPRRTCRSQGTTADTDPPTGSSVDKRVGKSAGASGSLAGPSDAKSCRRKRRHTWCVALRVQHPPHPGDRRHGARSPRCTRRSACRYCSSARFAGRRRTPRRFRLEPIVDLFLGPEIAVAILHPLEIGRGHASAVGQDVRYDEDATTSRR